MDKILEKQEQGCGMIMRFMINTDKTASNKQIKEYLEGRVQLLQSYWNQFTANHEFLCSEADEELQKQNYFTENRYDEIEHKYSESLGELLGRISKFSSGELNTNQPTSKNHVETISICKPKLPDIAIPSFNGELLHWPPFRDLYRSLIHDNINLPCIHKFHYLKSSLTGEALNLIKHISVTSVNYLSAWNILNARYDNVRMLTASYISSIMNLSNMSTESSTEIKRLLDNTSQSVEALANLGRPTQQWDDWLTYAVTQKLDPQTRKDWEHSLSDSREIPTFDKLKHFLEGRLRTLEAFSNNSTKPSSTRTSTSSRTHISLTSNRCVACSGKHLLLFCPAFRIKSVEQRRKFVKDNNLCFNCLRTGHSVHTCRISATCKRCGKQHHTTLHEPAQNDDTSSVPHQSSSHQNQPTTSHVAIHISSTVGQVLLATAKVLVRSKEGITRHARALLDQGSESTFVSNSLAKSLGLKREQVNIPVLGISNCKAGLAQSRVRFDILAERDKSRSFSVTALVLSHLTSVLPNTPITLKQWPHLKDLDLADPEFATPSVIDIIFGADLVADLLLDGIRRGPSGSPVAQRTHLGWILSGTINAESNAATQSSVTFHLRLGEDINATLRRFWEIQEIQAAPILSPDEEACEDIFRKTVQRNSSGRYVVRLPFKYNDINLGSTRDGAISSLLSMEKRFSQNNVLREQYIKFMDDYLTLGHMEPIHDFELRKKTPDHYYLPHHAVLKPSSSSTKLRVVFNASYRSTLGVSLNECLHIGPKLQQDLSTIILRWRLYPVVYVADIEKMYRQILLHQQDTNYQRIVWRNQSSSQIQDYKLLTVTYGTASAPYLACRVLQQLAEDHKSDHPLGSEIIRKHFYVDDVLFGAYDKTSALQAKNDLNQILARGGLTLRKWASNIDELLDGIPDQDKELPSAPRTLSDSEIKTLGILWHPCNDSFRLKVQLSSTKSPAVTKRSILADISRIFDPAGWFAPSTVQGKIFLQKLWLAQLDWDSELPVELASEWQHYRDQLTLLEDIHINRWLGTTSSNMALELHGFCDASTLAYSAAVYLRILHDNDHAQVSLLGCKTKVAPLKTISVPRLELCGAVLLTKLIRSIRDALQLHSIPTYAWTDSTIVLEWLKGHPCRWQTFIANRVSEIQSTHPRVTWKHISTADNPADCASRGIGPAELHNHPLWWTGPPWLAKPSSMWPKKILSGPIQSDLEEKSPVKCHTTQVCSTWDLLMRYSSLQRLLRITAWCLLFIKACRTKTRLGITILPPAEVNRALEFWVRHVQQSSLSGDIQALKKEQSLSRRSKLLSLHPVLDANNLLRVGGRLRNAPTPFSERHPLIIPADTPLTTLIIEDAHQQTLHGGTQLTLQHIRTKFWLLNGRNKVRSYIHRCMRCFRQRGAAKYQLMGDLPEPRVTPSKTFEHTGIDYAGPITITALRYRGTKSFKSYVAVFICLSTRAVHIELVTQLTSEAFIAAFRRFVARRGRCSHIYSDNATNFVGADTILQKHLQEAIGQQSSTIRGAISKEGVEWHFIPPSSPHVGGLWEAAIKSMKHHLRRVIGYNILSIEELLTLLAQVEACLNSRPLYPLTDDPEDFSVITPGHFLMNCAPLTVPEPSLLESSPNLHSRWKLIQAMLQHFWNRWHQEYIHHLQQRRKWQNKQVPIKVNDLVLVKNDNFPPCKWMLARVVETFPGDDNITRVVKLKYSAGFLKRHVNTLCVLPVTN